MEDTTSKITVDHDEIQTWIENHDGSPALNDTGIERGRLAINFGDEKEYEPLSWEEFFDHFDSMNLAFQYHVADQEEGDEFSYSFIDRKLIPTETEDDDGGMGTPNSDIPRENTHPSASPNSYDPDNMGEDGEMEDGDIVEELRERDEDEGM